MKKIILFGAILSIFLMVMMPNINAVNNQVRKHVIEEMINDYQNGIGIYKKIESEFFA